jgi:hypothetical protein
MFMFMFMFMAVFMPVRWVSGVRCSLACASCSMRHVLGPASRHFLPHLSCPEAQLVTAHPMRTCSCGCSRTCAWHNSVHTR